MVEKIKDIYVNWDKSKVIKNSLCSGKKYATYHDQNCTSFYWWLSRTELNNYKKGIIN